MLRVTAGSTTTFQQVLTPCTPPVAPAATNAAQHKPLGLASSTLPHQPLACPRGTRSLRRQWTTAKPGGRGDVSCNVLPFFLDLSLAFAPGMEFFDTVKSSVDSEVVFQATLQVRRGAGCVCALLACLAGAAACLRAPCVVLLCLQHAYCFHSAMCQGYAAASWGCLAAALLRRSFSTAVQRSAARSQHQQYCQGHLAAVCQAPAQRSSPTLAPLPRLPARPAPCVHCMQVPAHHALACRLNAYGTPFAAPDLQAAAHELRDEDLEFAACLATPPDLDEQLSVNFGRVMSMLEKNQGQGGGQIATRVAQTRADAGSRWAWAPGLRLRAASSAVAEGGTFAVLRHSVEHAM